MVLVWYRYVRYRPVAHFGDSDKISCSSEFSPVYTTLESPKSRRVARHVIED